MKELPKAYEPSKYEDGIYKKWEKSGVFNPDKIPPTPFNKGGILGERKSYCISMPPPNVTGTLHMGHAVMLAIEDILTRYHRMKGERTLWVPGTDHAAIATQTKVEKLLKEKGQDRHKLGREKFLKEVNKFAQESRDTIVNQIKKMGSSCDWSREAYTLDETRTRAVRTVFKMMYDDGLIYRGERIVNWCPRCHSTLADDEVEYKAQKTKLYTFKYSKNFPFTIATTRPETKLGDTAVAVNPKDKRYKKYIGKIYKVDFLAVKLNLKIIADREVDMNFGTGALGVTPAHSAIDWQMAEENGLKKIKVINESGNIREEFGEFSGENVFKARKTIVKKLKENGLMEKEEEVDNNLSLCYRCDTPIEPLPSLQWFIDINKPLRGRKQETGNRKQEIKTEGKSLKEIALEVVRDKKIKIIPERFEKEYFRWMENLRDWCISRQIWFGHRIPVWCKTGNRKQETENKDQEIYVGVEAPEGEEWTQDEDTLDTWFSSGLWTFSTLAKSPDEIKIEDGKLVIDSEDFKNFHPTTVMETGYDILFFWIARMIIMTTYAVGDIPFKDVYLHGLVRDEKGKKMSKSLGNVIDPLDMIKKYGTDATRLSLVMGSTPGNDMSLSEEKVAGFRNFANKLWNIFRYIWDYFLDEDFYKIKENENWTLSDKWILSRVSWVGVAVTDCLENYNFSRAGEILKNFTWNDFADWYLEISKVEKTKEKNAIFTSVFSDLLKLWHPFIPFVTEEIWQTIYKKSKNKLLMVEEWPHSDVYGSWFKKEIEKDFNFIIDIIKSIRNARSENKVEPAKKIKAVIYAGDSKKMELIKSQAHLIKNLRTGISELEIKEKSEKIKDAIYIAVEDIEIYLIGARDEKKEKARIKKEIENLEKIIKAAKIKLENKDFVNKAPERVVSIEKEKLAKAEGELGKLRK